MANASRRRRRRCQLLQQNGLYVYRHNVVFRFTPHILYRCGAAAHMLKCLCVQYSFTHNCEERTRFCGDGNVESRQNMQIVGLIKNAMCNPTTPIYTLNVPVYILKLCD